MYLPLRDATGIGTIRPIAVTLSDLQYQPVTSNINLHILGA
jgi:hypothetical protein